MKKSSGRQHEKSILVLSATAGAGHVRAGEALIDTAKKLSLPIKIQHEDILNFTSPVFKKLYNDLYFAIVNASPDLWGYLYKRTEFKGPGKERSPLIKLFDQFNYKKYLQALEEIQPDAVLCTHFLPYAAIAHELRKPSWKIPFFVATTDYDVHSLWINPNIEHYYTASEEAAWTIQSHGIGKNKVTVTGIPVMPQFGVHNKQKEAENNLNLLPSTFTIMILSGGYGVGMIDKLIPSVADLLSTYKQKKFQMLVVCGNNQKLYDKLKQIAFPRNISIQLYKFISFVDQLMDCADVLITKSGGLTVSEALAKHLPMIIFDPIPGQEGRNAEYLTEHGAALRAFSFPNLQFKLKQIIEQPAVTKKMKSNAERIAHPDAAKNILEDVIKNIS